MLKIGDRVVTIRRCFLKPRLKGVIESAGDTPGTWFVRFDAPSKKCRGALWLLKEEELELIEKRKEGEV
jgi:hypothetical protein